MLSKLLLVTKTTLLCFFFFSFHCFQSFFLAIPVLIKNTKLGIVLVISTGEPVTVADDAIETLSPVSDRTKSYEKPQMQEYI